MFVLPVPFKLLVLLLFVSLQTMGKEPGFVLVGKETEAVIVLDKGASGPVRLAVADLVSDIQKITGKTLKVVTAVPKGQPAFVIQTLPKGPWEQYRIHTQGSNCYISGTDERGTVFGIYRFCEAYLNVDPFYFWNDNEPQKKAVLSWASIHKESGSPTVNYRGWFINDEDLLTEWYDTKGKRNIDYPYYQQVTSPEIMKKICETALRLRFNLLIPASFIDILNPDEAALVKVAAQHGLFVSMHHVEPMGVSAFTYFNYWKERTGEKPLFSYYSNRQKVEEVWKVYAAEWAKYPNVIWQVGLRGIADRPMWLADANIPQSDAERGRLISDAMRFQLELIKQVDKRKEVPVTTTLWAEGSTLYNQGFLTIPKNVIIVFSDNSPGWRWQSDFDHTKRQPYRKYGVYYHHQLWASGPHLVQIVPPAQTYSVLNRAVQKGDTTYCIMNVSNIREFQLGISASSHMLWNFSGFDLAQFNKQWFTKHYGKWAAPVQQVYDAYFKSFALGGPNQTPVLMDGHIALFGSKLLNEMKLQLTDTVAYAAMQKKRAEDETTRWAKATLSDMNGITEVNEESRQKLLEEERQLQDVSVMAAKLEQQLAPAEKEFFNVNFRSHVKMMQGLTGWLKNLMLAQKSLSTGNMLTAKKAVSNALQSLVLVKEGKQMNTASPKWKDWYRGEKKMNMERREKQTQEVLERLNNMKQ